MSVYKLTCSKTNEIYYGSTKMTLEERKSKGWYKCSCKDFINPKMECIEKVENLDELEIRENHYIMNNECVNKNMAYTDAQYKKLQTKKYRAKIFEEKRFECKLCKICFQAPKKLERHNNGYRHKLKNESFLKYGEDWEKHYLEDNKKRYNQNRKTKSKKA